MSESKPLPDGLASDIRHLVVELRVLKERGGLSLAALAVRTPYSKSSWERYLNAKALPPLHAVASLGKLADADPGRLAALWELANAAWHDREARESGAGREVGAAGEADELAPEASAPGPGPEPVATAGTGEPEYPEQPEQPERSEYPEQPELIAGRGFSRRTLVWAAVVLAVAAALSAFLTGAFSPHAAVGADRVATPGPDTPTRQLDVNCFADSCDGKNPGPAGCGGDAWTSALRRVDGVYLELRYSDACKAAWARISWGRPGDIARVVATGGRSHQDKVHYDTDIYSPMVAAPSPSAAKACFQLTSGLRACTLPGGTEHLTEAPNPPIPPSARPATTPAK